MFLNATKMSCYFSSFCLLIVVVTVSFLFVCFSFSLSLAVGGGGGGNGQTVRGERRRKTQGGYIRTR